MTEDEISASQAREVAKEVVRETLLQLGFDAEEPGAIQRDLNYLRQLRLGSEETSRILKRCAISTFWTALVTLILLAIKQWFK